MALLLQIPCLEKHIFTTWGGQKIQRFIKTLLFQDYNQTKRRWHWSKRDNGLNMTSTNPEPAVWKSCIRFKTPMIAKFIVTRFEIWLYDYLINTSIISVIHRFIWFMNKNIQNLYGVICVSSNAIILNMTNRFSKPRFDSDW